MDPSEKWSAESWLVAGARPTKPGDPLNTPIVAASNYVRGGEWEYARDEGTPTWVALETLLGRLESGRALAFGSGMAAIAAVFDQLAVGAHVIWPDDCYQGVAGIISDGEKRGRWTSSRIAVHDTAQWVAAAASADLIWLESPSNPLLAIADLRAIAGANRKADSILAVDNTVATPLNQQPLQLGADVSVMAATKYVGGHSDLLCGVAITNDDALHSALFRSRLLNGATPGSLETFLAVRGARTLSIRLAAAQESAQILAERLEAHPAVVKVRYPGLPSHPQHELAKAQLNGNGTLISFDVPDGATADAFVTALELITNATSFGAVESTIERRSTISGQQHLPPGLLRFSVGIEDVEDLWRDLDNALA
ncbi:MAG: PLP-dependent transferase [Acidimicrobiales bacterium]|nr:PLP-dependent transferase [Acidimicrobiales bacterium]